MIQPNGARPPRMLFWRSSAGGSIIGDLTLEIYSEQIRLSAFPDNLSPVEGDDRILFLLKQYRHDKSIVQVSVFAEDFGMIVRCAANSIPAMEPDKSTRLADHLSESQESNNSKSRSLMQVLNRQKA